MVPKGVCHLCGEEKSLTYEHVPAQSSFNKLPVEMFGLESLLRQDPEGQMTGGRMMDRGAGAYTLCYDCNTPITGDHYVAELKRWTAMGMSVLSKELASGAEGNAIEWQLKNVYPARILKQIVAMLASVNSASLLEHHRLLREYAMNPQAVGLPSRYQFYLLLTHPKSTVARYAGLSMRLASGTWCATWVTDLVWPPFGYVMTIDEPRPLLSIGNISHFANYGYDDRVDLELQLPVLLGEHPYPGEYGDPVANGAFTNKQVEAFPTAQSVMIPVRVRLADGYETDGAELSHPLPFENWTREELRNVVEALLRTLCVREGEQHTVVIKWSEGEGVLLRVTSGSRSAETEYVPVPFAAVAAFIGHDEELPPKGISGYEDVLRFKDSGRDPQAAG